MTTDWTQRLREQAERLRAMAQGLLSKKKRTGEDEYSSGWEAVPRDEALAWDTRARALLEQPLLPLVYLKQFAGRCHHPYQAEDMSSGATVLAALIADIDDGHFPSIGTAAHASTLSDLLSQAEGLARDGQSLPAVMLAGGVVEAHLRFLAETRSVPMPSKPALGTLNEALAKAGVYDKATNATITAWTTMRNQADHLTVTKFHDASVDAMLHGVRSFLANLPH